MCLPSIIKTDFSCDKDIWIAITDYYYLFVLFLLVWASPMLFKVTFFNN